MEIFNKFVLGGYGDEIVFCATPCPRRLSKDDAILLAAWLIALADPCHEKFFMILEKVENS